MVDYSRRYTTNFWVRKRPHPKAWPPAMLPDYDARDVRHMPGTSLTMAALPVMSHTPRINSARCAPHERCASCDSGAITSYRANAVHRAPLVRDGPSCPHSCPANSGLPRRDTSRIRFPESLAGIDIFFPLFLVHEPVPGA